MKNKNEYIRIPGHLPIFTEELTVITNAFILTVEFYINITNSFYINFAIQCEDIFSIFKSIEIFKDIKYQRFVEYGRRSTAVRLSQME